MDLIHTILSAIVTLGLLVAFHEFGHFWVARRCGIKVLRFSIGFGKPLWRHIDKQGTEYTIAAIPLGGYVRMLDEREGEVDPNELSQTFNRASVWARIAVVSAGPVANFLLAIVVFWALFLRGESGLIPMVGGITENSPAYYAGVEVGQEIVAVDGKPTPTVAALNLRLLDRLGDTGSVTLSARYPLSDVIYESEAPITRWLADQEAPSPITGLGIVLDLPELLPIIDTVVPSSPAESAGFKAADQVLKADGEAMPLWADWVDYVRARPGQVIEVEVLREGATLTLWVTPEATQRDGEVIGSVGLGVRAPELDANRVRSFDRGPVEALGAALLRTGELIRFTFESMGKMLQGLISPKNLSGPITIAQVAGSSVASGWVSWLSLLGLLSISLGALNLLPIPVLDGGHLLFYLLEALTGRPVPEKVQGLGYQIGLVLVLSLMAFALYNDVVRL
jgi:regulator of sigma E protease